MNEEFRDFARHGASLALNVDMIYYVIAGFGHFETSGEMVMGISLFAVLSIIRLMALQDVWMRAAKMDLHEGRGSVFLAVNFVMGALMVVLFYFVKHNLTDTERFWVIFELIACILEVPCELIRQRVVRTGAILTSNNMDSDVHVTYTAYSEPLTEEGNNSINDKEGGDKEKSLPSMTEEFLKLFEKKSKETFEKDFYSLLVLSFYGENERKMKISEKK